LDVGDREVLLRPEPPEIEWWDEDYLTNKSYDDIERGQIKLEGEETKITLYIQHPIPIPPPSITHAPPARPVMMTAKEMQRARRLRRAEEQKDTRGKILLGLMPPEPPKIKMANLMKVLTSEAVKDPTAVERRVRKEIDARKNKHEQDNEARKLTKDEKHVKQSEKRATDVLRTGLHCCLFRIANLSNPRHRYKIRTNAAQLELTGIVILNPRTNIVIVEGGMPAIKKYKRLMTTRIDWTDNSRNPIIAKGNQEMLEDEPEPEDLSGNTCELVWEGELSTRNFKKWIGEREASNDAAARKWLGKGAENFWRLAVRSEQA
jgi:U4/U6 small nuclear ribonucleoprotein PRP3